MLAEFGAQDVLTYLCRTNPGRLIEDEPPLPVPVLPAERRLWARVRSMLRRSTA
jgi:hypothetical protein